MFAVIATDDKKDIIMRIVGESAVYNAFGSFDINGIKKVFEEALRVPASTMILDADVCPPANLVESVKTYRAQRKNRIVLLAPGREPGDTLVNALVARGVYDIVDGDNWEEGLKKTLKEPPADYAAAVRWDVHGLETTPIKNLETKTKLSNFLTRHVEQQVERHVQQPVERQMELRGTFTITVAGSEKGAGTTHTALSIAAFLARQGHSVALMEMVYPRPTIMDPSAFTILSIYLRDGIEQRDGYYRFANIDVYNQLLDEENSYMNQLYGRNYKYVVLDIGNISSLENKYIDEMRRSKVSILVSSVAPWRGYELMNMYQGSKENIRRLAGFFSWKIVFLTGDDKSYSMKKEMLGEELDVYKLPFHSPFEAHEERDSVIMSILGQNQHGVLPRKHKKGFISLFKK